MGNDWTVEAAEGGDVSATHMHDDGPHVAEFEIGDDGLRYAKCSACDATLAVDRDTGPEAAEIS